jgi:predicted ATP-grasp superfamily ATP-dependent carboligase
MHTTEGPCDALVLGADEHTGLATARNLHRAGLRVLGGGLDPQGFGFWSNALRARFIYPSPERDRRGFIVAVKEAALRHRVKAILPSLDTALIALHESRPEFDGVAPLGIAPEGPLNTIRDKLRLREVAEPLGVEMPRTFWVDHDPESLPLDFPLPAIVKQRDSGHLAPRKVIYCATRKGVLAGLRLYLDHGYAPLVQELIYGYGTSVVTLCRNGKMLQTFQYQKPREYSCRGGIGTLRVSQPVSPELGSRSARLLEALGWEGIAGVEFKVPLAQPDHPRLLEINARFVGTIDLARASGINFPHLQYLMTTGQEVPAEQIPYRAGVRYRKWLWDSCALMELLFDRPAVTGVPLPGRARALWNYVEAYGPHVGSDNFQLRDPLPGVMDFFQGLPILAKAFVRALREGGSRAVAALVTTIAPYLASLLEAY